MNHRFSQFDACFAATILMFLSFWAGGLGAQEALHLTKSEIRTTRGELVSIESGKLAVPSNRDRPEDARVTLAFVRVLGPERDNAPPTFVLAGGPGDSGIDVVRGMIAKGGPNVQAILRGDIVGVDQRGTGASQPNLEVHARLTLPLNQACSKQDYAEQLGRAFRDTARQIRQKGVALGDFNILENAADIDELRAALGYDKMALWGTSFGSQLGLTIIKNYPESVERAVFHSPEGLDHTWKHPLWVDECIVRIADGDRTILETLRRVLMKLEKSPVMQSIVDPRTGRRLEVVIGPFDIQLMVWSAVSKRETMSQLVAGLGAMDRGDFRFPAAWVARYRAAAEVGNAMKHLMDHSSGVSQTRLNAIRQAETQCPLSDVLNVTLEVGAESWGVEPLPGSHREPFVSDHPVLLFCGDYDARTPLQNSRQILGGLSNGRLVVVQGGGHGFVPSPQILGIVRDFYVGLPIPREQTLRAGRYP